VIFEYWINNCPGRLHSILTGKKRAVTRYGVSQKPLIRRLFPGLFFNDIEFFLFADKFFALTLNTCS
jgi:hypothetical protein